MPKPKQPLLPHIQTLLDRWKKIQEERGLNANDLVPLTRLSQTALYRYLPANDRTPPAKNMTAHVYTELTAVFDKLEDIRHNTTPWDTKLIYYGSTTS